MEHMIKIDTAVVADPAGFRAKYPSRPMTPEAILAFQEDVVRSGDEEKKKALFKKFVDNGTWQSPTLTVLRSGAYLRERAELDKERLTYLPKQVTREWLPENNPQAKYVTDEKQWEAARVRFAYQQRLVGDMYKAGVKIIAGTDVLNPFCFPGFSLHDELEMLVQAGLPPMAALQAATVNAAEYSGKSNDLGTVAEGKIADLVLLRANPLEDIRNTTKISAVILNGVLHDRQALDGMLHQMQERANYGK
jgi:imidazolonepropionase-like amidohydrolase